MDEAGAEAHEQRTDEAKNLSGNQDCAWSVQYRSVLSWHSTEISQLSTDKIDLVCEDVEVLKKIVSDHDEKLKKCKSCC